MSKVNIRFYGHGDVMLSCDRWERAGAPAIVLLHGGGQTRHAWGETAANLYDRGYDITSMDLRGHGDSDWSASGDYGLSDFRDDLRCVLVSLNRPAILVGASLGGLASLLAIGEVGHGKVAGLILVDIAPTQAEEGRRKIQAFMRSAPEGFGSLDEAVQAVAAYQSHRDRVTNPSGLMKNLRHRNGRYFWHWDPAIMVAGISRGDSDVARLEAAASNVNVPVLLVRGGRSEIVSDRDVARLLELIPHARVVEIKDARHMVAGDQNTAFGEAMLTFLGHVAKQSSPLECACARPTATWRSHDA